jgi:hypothetical protein
VVEAACVAREAKVMTDARTLRDRVELELAGIDKDQSASPDGWWETSTGAAFGAGKLSNILALLTQGDAHEQAREERLRALVEKWRAQATRSSGPLEVMLRLHAAELKQELDR